MINATNINFNIDIDEFVNFYIKTVDRNLNFLGTHSRNTSIISENIAKFLNVKCPEKKLLKYGAILHDIGKLFVPAEILNAGRPLSSIEFEMIKAHAVFGYEILEQFESLKDIKSFALNHHYRNGFGYPKHINFGKNEIDPLLIDILTVADSFSAIMEPRVYKKSLNESQALEIIKNPDNDKNAGLNSEVLEALTYLVDNDRISLSSFF
ncbi:MAG: HD domain-containing protein [Candidatus Marsarchaeota archaeon]|jgi:putative nucleotidyltransferase with HDIG domain|nr:HD domain-containing protein [Candidatus Marsarchaeota archaeon]